MQRKQVVENLARGIVTGAKYMAGSCKLRNFGLAAHGLSLRVKSGI